LGRLRVVVTQELADELRSDEAKADLVSWVDRNWGTNAKAKKLAVKSERCLDLLEISRGHFYDPAMMGSHSIKKVLPVVWKNPAIQKLFPKYAQDQHGQPVKNPYDALPALTLQDSKDHALDLSKLDELDVVKNGPGAMLAYEHIRYGLAASDQVRPQVHAPPAHALLRAGYRRDGDGVEVLVGLMTQPRGHVGTVTRDMGRTDAVQRCKSACGLCKSAKVR
jgi:hypothetical protein